MTRQKTAISDQLINTFFPKQFLATIQSAPTSETPASSTPASKIVPHPKLTHKLRIAREKLQQSDGPQMLKVLAYLRISCNLMRQVQTNSPHTSSAAAVTSYAELVKALLAHDRNWWTHCTINSTGCLRSSDAIVDHLLSAIAEFHQLYG